MELVRLTAPATSLPTLRVVDAATTVTVVKTMILNLEIRVDEVSAIVDEIVLLVIFETVSVTLTTEDSSLLIDRDMLAVTVTTGVRGFPTARVKLGMATNVATKVMNLVLRVMSVGTSVTTATHRR